MKCVIFGGGGFIGSTIADELLQQGHQLRIFEHPKVIPYREFNENESVEWCSGDFFKTTDLEMAIEGMEVVIHLISTTLPKNSNDNPVYDVQTNIIGSLTMFDIIRAKGIKKVIFISSGGTVYGNPKYLPIDEKHPTNPLVSYGITKLAIEKYLQMYESLYGIKTIILRVANPYGERQRIDTAQGAVGIFLHNALNKHPITIWGDGTITRDYIHVSDVAKAFAKAVDYSGNENVFNISSGTGISLNELITILEQVTGNSITRHYLPARAFDVPISILCNKLAAQQLQWQPLISMSAGIAKTAAWMSL